MSKNNTNEKFPILNQTHPLTPLKKSNMATMYNEYFYSLGRPFCSKWSSNIIPRPVLSRNKQRGHFLFLTKIMG